jgi:hypothetical protein
MSVNLNIFPTEAQADVFLADGSIVPIAAQQESFIQLPSGSFCTIVSTAGNEETSEHPPINGEAFAEAMIDFWRSMVDKIRAEAAGAPTATPV